MGNKKIVIKILVENSVHKKGLLAEHGLSFLIEYKDQKYLFDTGQGLVLEHNAQQLGVDFSQLNGVLISHGHYDHGNGLAGVLSEDSELAVYAHPDIFKSKYSIEEKGPTFKGINIELIELNKFISTAEPTKIESGMWLTGEIPRTNQLGTTNDKYQIKEDGELKKDKFLDDQAVFIETDKGIVVLLACTHAGVINTLDYVQELTNDKISAVIGGMHLVHAEKSKVNRIADYLAELDLDLLVPLHCTGKKAEQILANRLPTAVDCAGVGDEFSFLA